MWLILAVYCNNGDAAIAQRQRVRGLSKQNQSATVVALMLDVNVM